MKMFRNERSKVNEVNEVRYSLSHESWPLILQFRIFMTPINILFLSRSVPEATQIRAN